MKHLDDIDLALLAGGDAGRVRRYSLERHVRMCTDCRERVDGFRSLRGALANAEMPDLNWGSLAAEMRANIRVGLEAGECVRETRGFRHRVFEDWSFGLAAAFACVMLLVGASFFMRDVRQPGRFPQITTRPGAVASGSLPSLESTTAGVALHSGDSSFTLLNREGAVASQTVSAQGAVRSRYVDAGTVTINNVYLE
jgi:hypothetical protein